MIPSASLHLLTQDNSIPGNKKDGFRYHHLLFVIFATPVYLWFELSFGVRLLDNISGTITTDSTNAIEHWGRLISGMAVSLLFLTGWARQCEKWNTHWMGRILGGIAICFVCVLITWWAQEKLIDFYIHRTTVQISVAVGLLSILVVAGFLVLRYWLQYSLKQQKLPYARAGAGLIVILLGGYVLISNVSMVLPEFTEKLGQERQRAATLTLVRRGMQEGVYALPGVDPDPKALASPEGKAFLALFPIFGTAIPDELFVPGRAKLVRDLVFKDWNQTSGDPSFAGYQDAIKELQQVYETSYTSASEKYVRDMKSGNAKAAAAAWDTAIRDAMGGEYMAPKLTLAKFLRDPAVLKSIRMKLGCFDCNFRADMTRDEFLAELFKWTQNSRVENILNTLDSPKHFEKGHDGETAARTYWVPIWALLFSMVGAFTHIFKLIFTVSEYANRQTFHSINAADSRLANRVVENSRIISAAVVIALGLFVYFADNRITGHPRYVEVRHVLWKTHPIVGGIAAHWTVNAQGYLYPFTSKIRPSWLEFNEDPLANVPFVSKWVEKEY